MVPGANGTNGANGATGPQGPQGIQGIQGPIGPNGTQRPQDIPGQAGPNQISTTKIYKQFGPNVTSIILPTFNWIANSTPTCLPGDTFLSIGYRVIAVDFQDGLVIHEVSVKTEPTSTEDGWTVEIQGRDDFTLVSISQCFDN